MLQRGFDGSFVVAFKDGEKIGLYDAIRATNGKLPRSSSAKKSISKVENKQEVEVKPNLEFVVLIGVYEENLQADVLANMIKIGNVNKENIAGTKLYTWYAGNYKEFSAANDRLSEVKSVGFKDAFVIAFLDKKEITIEQARNLLE